MAGMNISLDKLPIKRLDFIEESGVEQFPREIGYEEKTESLIRRVDFSWAVERDSKKQKKNKETKKDGPPSSGWQGFVENLQLAHQELHVIIDLINTVEANDAVAVAGMNRPKPLPNELLSDLAVSTATKLQSYRHLSNYFKKSANSLEDQMAREGRFYGALIRLQQNWKIKRHRLATNVHGSERFLIDLTDSSLHERVPAFSIVGVDHDPSGMLAVNVSKNYCSTLHFGFLDAKMNSHAFKGETKKDYVSDEDRIRDTHKVLRDVHKSIFYEQLFELVSRESFKPSLGVNVTGIREKYLELSINPGLSVFVALEPSKQEDKGKATQNVEDTSNGASFVVCKQDAEVKFGCPNHIAYEIYVQQLFHDEMFGKEEDKPALPGRSQPNQQGKDAGGLVSHFCLSLAHRIFSNQVLKELENLVTKIPYLQLITQPTWYSRTSTWTLSVKVPESVLNGRLQTWRSDEQEMEISKSLFQTKVLLKDDCISIEGGGAPNAAGLFKYNPQAVGFKNRFNCDLVDLPMVLLLQVTSKIIDWLHEEALMVGIKTKRDFLSLSFEINHGETLSLSGHVDPDDTQGCISWWLTLEDGFTKEPKLKLDHPDEEPSTRRCLGHLSLDELYSTLMDLVSLCTGSSNH